MRTERYTGSEIKSGFLIVLSAATLLVLLFMTGTSQLFKRTYEIHITFNYISGLVNNSPVHFAGHEAGKVTRIDLLNQEGAKVRITVSLSDNVVLKKDSEAYIDVMGFMGEKFIELTPGSSAAQPLLPHETIRGTDPIPVMEIVKRGTELLDQFEEISGSLSGMTEDLSKIVGENEDEIDGMIKNFNSVSSNLNEMTEDLKYHPWKLFRKGKERKRSPSTSGSTKQVGTNDVESSGKKRRFLFF